LLDIQVGSALDEFVLPSLVHTGKRHLEIEVDKWLSSKHVPTKNRLSAAMFCGGHCRLTLRKHKRDAPI
jgi:hypothetical protein